MRMNKSSFRVSKMDDTDDAKYSSTLRGTLKRIGTYTEETITGAISAARSRFANYDKTDPVTMAYATHLTMVYNDPFNNPDAVGELAQSLATEIYNSQTDARGVIADYAADVLRYYFILALDEDER